MPYIELIWILAITLEVCWLEIWIIMVTTHIDENTQDTLTQGIQLTDLIKDYEQIFS